MVNEVNDELHFMDALKISVSRVITGFHQSFKTCLHQSGNADTEDRLLTDEVGFGFNPEGSFKRCV